MRKLITDLQPNTEYSFVLMNRGSSAGPAAPRVISTAPGLLHAQATAGPQPSSGPGRFLTMPRVQDPAHRQVCRRVSGVGEEVGLVMQERGEDSLIRLCPPRWFYIMVVPIDRVGGHAGATVEHTEELELDEVPGPGQEQP